MHYTDFQIAWICALPVELAAAEGMLDEVYDALPQKEHDSNTYKYGRIGRHNVVLACLPAGVLGLTSAAGVAGTVRRSFGELKLGLMVGIGGGVPGRLDIRLGDVVVSKPTGNFGGVVQYDMGRTVQGGRFAQTGSLNRPPDALLTAVTALQAKHWKGDSDVLKHLSDMITRYPKMQSPFDYQGAQHDQLFEAGYEHVGDPETCRNCDKTKLVQRSRRENNDPKIHYGTIASGNQVMRHGETRDRLAATLGALCFEMEAAGLMDTFPCLIVRGICD